DGDERRRLLRRDVGDGLGDAAKDAAGAGQHLGDAHDRELRQGHARDEALRRHGLAADPGKAHRALGALAQRRHQPSAEEIARRLAGNEINERRRITHWALTPTTNIPARSSTSVAPASMAMPRSPAAAAAATVEGPIAGRSARRSWPGLAVLTRTPPGAAQFAIRASVPASPSTPKTSPARTITAWPRSRAPCARAASRPVAMSRSAAASGATRPNVPNGASRSPRMRSAPVTRKPSPSSSLMIARKSAPSPRSVSALSPIFRRKRKARQSGRNAASEGR